MRPRLAWILAALLAGCVTKDATPPEPADPEDTALPDSGDSGDSGDTAPDDTGPPDGWTRDADGDGYGAAVDCDDTDATVFPTAVETCDGRDEDCDGRADEDGGCVGATEATVADATATLLGAEGQWAGWAVAAADIDGDALVDVVVGAPVDAGETGAVLVASFPFEDGPLGAAAWTGDAVRDRLGYAIAGAPGVAVVGAPGHDDGATEGGAVWILRGEERRLVAGTVDRAAAGSAVAAGDVDGDGTSDVVVGAPWDDVGGWAAGTAYVLRGAEATLEEGVRLDGDAGDAAGSAVAIVGDTDGDGLGDVVVGRPSAEEDAGVAVWFAGPVVGGDEGIRWVGPAAGDGAGAAVVGLGDVDGDGLPDWAVGGTGHDGGGTNAGAIWIVPGGSAGGSLGDVVALRGVAAFDYVGGSVAWPGDIDGDGRAEVAVGAAGVDAAGTEAGAVYVAWAPFPASRGVAEAAVRVSGAAAHDQAVVVAAGGDLDGDGVPDVLVGAWRADTGGEEAGAVYVLSGAGL